MEHQHENRVDALQKAIECKAANLPDLDAISRTTAVVCLLFFPLANGFVQQTTVETEFFVENVAEFRVNAARQRHFVVRSKLRFHDLRLLTA